MEKKKEYTQRHMPDETVHLDLEDILFFLKETLECDKTTFCCIPIRSLDVIVSALEMRLAKEPELVAYGCDMDGDDIFDTWICPHCGTEYEQDIDKFDYCPECGQAIDWNSEMQW